MINNISQIVDSSTSNAEGSRVEAIVEAQIESLKQADLPKRRSKFLALQSARLAHRQAFDDYTSAALVGRGDSLDGALARRDAAAAALRQAQLDFDQACYQSAGKVALPTDKTHNERTANQAQAEVDLKFTANQRKQSNDQIQL